MICKYYYSLPTRQELGQQLLTDKQELEALLLESEQVRTIGYLCILTERQ